MRRGERYAAKLDAEEAAAKEEQDTEEAEEDPDMEIPNEESQDTNIAEMMSHPSELKAGLPEDFSGNSKDSNRWCCPSKPTSRWTPLSTTIRQNY